MSNFIDQLENLYKHELYSNVLKVCDFALTASEPKSDFLNLTTKFKVTEYYADALYHTKNYQQAEHQYRQALLLRKTAIYKMKSTSSSLDKCLETDAEIKYKIHLCCVAMKQWKQAVDILQSISARTRTPRVNMALGNLCKEFGMERAAIACFREVLRECPLALDAVESLLKLGVKGVEVNSLMVGVSSDVGWLSTWIKAQAQLHSREFSNAIQTYKSMETYGLLVDNATLLVNMAYCYHYLCDETKAISLLQKAILLNPNITFGKDLLSTLLAASGTKEHVRYLESMVPTTEMDCWTCEQWVILGNYMYAIKKYDKAAYFGQQGCLMNRWNVEAFLLKANTFLQIKKYEEAETHCTEALQLCSFRYDLHKCLVECYIQSNRLREAEAMALHACEELNYSAQACTLHASVLMKNTNNPGKNIRKILERAVAEDKTGATNALTMLVECLMHDQQYEQIVQLLLKQIEQYPTSRLHQLLGDCYMSMQVDDEAFNHYNLALKMDPTNQRATEGLHKIGKSGTSSKRDSYYTCVGETSQGTTASDPEGDVESDNDIWPAANDILNFE